MATNISIGSIITWTLESPKMTSKETEDFYAFVDDYLETYCKSSFIKGEVIDIYEGIALIRVTDMTPDMFPFTLFYNEAQNRIGKITIENTDPYQKYLCLNIDSMISITFYDVDLEYIGDAEFDDDGKFIYYDLPEEDMDIDTGIELMEEAGPELFTIRLSEEEIDSLENNNVLKRSDEIEWINEDGDSVIRADHCSMPRAVTWFNTRDCAILTAWRSGKDRKTNDDNNRQLQRKLRDLGYGVTKITGWFPEKDKEVARENSFLTVNLNEEGSFRDNIYKLSEFYEQDSFLYKKAGHDVPAVYVHTNDDTGKGTEKLAGRLRIGNMDAVVYSQIKTGRLTFE